MPDQGLVTAATGGKFMFRYLNPLKRPRFHFQVPGRRPCKRCDGFRQAVRPFLPLAHERLPKLRTHEVLRAKPSIPSDLPENGGRTSPEKPWRNRIGMSPKSDRKRERTIPGYSAET